MRAPKSSARGAGAADDVQPAVAVDGKVKAISHPHRPENMMQNVRQYPQFSWAHRRSSPRWITCVIGRKDGSRGSSPAANWNQSRCVRVYFAPQCHAAGQRAIHSHSSANRNRGPSKSGSTSRIEDRRGPCPAPPRTRPAI